MPGTTTDSTSAPLETEKFDFVIVGGGTSGLIVASRLTEDPNVKVLVLEAGANRLDDPRITTPGLAASLYDDPDFDWCFMSSPQVRSSST
jgi:choline dehydrogenase-like flavoprotein